MVLLCTRVDTYQDWRPFGIREFVVEVWACCESQFIPPLSSDFGVSAAALALTRKVEVYQWKESQRREQTTGWSPLMCHLSRFMLTPLRSSQSSCRFLWHQDNQDVLLIQPSMERFHHSILSI
jgi:hypothetical protein